MTSNSRAERTQLLAVALGVFIAGCSPTGSRTGEGAPDFPRPARAVGGVSQPTARVGDQSVSDRPVEISTVRLRSVRGDTLLTRLMGTQRMNSAREPIAIEVITAEPLGNVDRTASPEIYVDGVLIGDTWAFPPNRLIAFVPDRQRLRQGAAVTVAWLGSEERTRTRSPIVLTDNHIRGIR